MDLGGFLEEEEVGRRRHEFESYQPTGAEMLQVESHRGLCMCATNPGGPRTWRTSFLQGPK